MAILWVQNNGRFVSKTLPDTPGSGSPRAAPAPLRVVSFQEGTRPGHALITAAGGEVRVNGSAVVGDFRVLQHKDELVVGDQRMFFSAESAPVVEVYRQSEAPRLPRCPVCRAEIEVGQAVVCCPGCSRLYHQLAATESAAAKHCWSYRPECRFCEHPTSMSGDPSWRPEEEEQ